ncbi:uncharacterized protein LOC133779042 [Humulus lupulus]|uniref:uncharacterized protein LOC133779042 n=1 Tax=Humulus lupulus TaxID=3486 RepID=UPI002B401CE5|nr:uncharacterized protein LOC133779042 [Humulus lupulus]
MVLHFCHASARGLSEFSSDVVAGVGEVGGAPGSDNIARNVLDSKKKSSEVVEDASKTGDVGDDIGDVLPRRRNISRGKSVARKKSKSPSIVKQKRKSCASGSKKDKVDALGSKDVIVDSIETKHVVTHLKINPSKRIGSKVQHFNENNVIKYLKVKFTVTPRFRAMQIMTKVGFANKRTHKDGIMLQDCMSSLQDVDDLEYGDLEVFMISKDSSGNTLIFRDDFESGVPSSTHVRSRKPCGLGRCF